MSDALKPIPIVENIATLARGYELMLCDVWGVIHNGRDVFAEAAQACRAFRAGGGTVILVSNSPRPRDSLIEQLDAIGVTQDVYDGVATSGDVTRSYLVDRPEVRVLHIGPDRDKGIFKHLEVSFVAAQQAEIVICSGLFDDTSETPEDYRAELATLKGLGLTMVCANPDIKVERGDVLVYCAGALAQLYEELGGEVVYAGKPYRPVYDLAFGLAAELRGEAVEKTRVIAVGDGLETDIAGAADMGVASLFVASGLHVGSGGSELDQQEIAQLFAGRQGRPIAALARLRW